MSKPKYRFVIRYRSGAEVRVNADNLQIKWDTTEGRVVEATWSNMQPYPLALGIHNIESVWQED